MSIKKTLLIALATTLTSNLGYSQTKKQLAKIHMNVATKMQDRELLVVIDERSAEVANALKDAVEKEWRFTKYRFISPAEVDGYKGDEQYAIMHNSYVVWVKKEQVIDNRTEAQRSDTMSTSLGIALGSEKYATKPGMANVISRNYPFYRYYDRELNKAEESVLLANSNILKAKSSKKTVTDRTTIYPQLIALYVRDMDRVLNLWLQNSIHEATNFDIKEYRHTFFEEKERLTNKILYIGDYYLNGSISEESLRNAIEGDTKLGLKVQIVNAEQIAKAIREKDENVIISISMDDFPFGGPPFLQTYVRSAVDGDELASLVFKH